MKKLFSYLAMITLIIACHPNSNAVLDSTSVLFKNGEEVGKAPDMINEASGLAASVTNKGSMWTHNDSGGQPRVFLISNTAKLQAIVTLDSIENRDWEEVIVGSGPDESKSYLYIGEFGDNEAIYTTKYVYRLEEPLIDTVGNSPVVLTISNFDKIPIEYPDGKRDVETLFIDHKSRDLYFVSKREANVNVYVAKYPQSTDKVNVLTKLGSLPFHKIVAADMSSDNEILLKNYDNIFYWKVKDGESIYATLSQQPAILPYERESQGESITWDLDRSGYFTLSEKNGTTNPDLLYYKRSK